MRKEKDSSSSLKKHRDIDPRPSSGLPSPDLEREQGAAIESNVTRRSEDGYFSDPTRCRFNSYSENSDALIPPCSIARQGPRRPRVGKIAHPWSAPSRLLRFMSPALRINPQVNRLLRLREKR